MYGGDDKRAHISSGNMVGRDHLGDLSVSKRIILKCIFKEIGSNDVHLINLAHNKVQWRALVKTIMNSCV
jgi:hypothetical protein